jgi:Sulfotransferase family
MNRPVIVGGCHRSGTSLTRRLLNAHSQIHCGPEVKLLFELGGIPRDPVRHMRFIQTARSLVSEDDLVAVLMRALCELHERAAAQSGKPRWADKNPENAIHLGVWERTIGATWTFVHVVRNPLDTLASMKQVHFPYGLPPTLDERIDHYNRFTVGGLDFVLTHPSRSHVLQYELLVASPEAEIKRLMHALGEEFEEQQLAFNESPHQRGLEDPNIATTSRVHADSVGQWPAHLSADEAMQIRDGTADTWSRIDPEGRWLNPRPE